MTSPETIASILPFAIFLAALFRARWVALALAPPCALILARAAGFVDISSASHPLRFLTSIVGMSLAMFAAWWYAKALRQARIIESEELANFHRLRRDGTFIGTNADIMHNARTVARIVPITRALVASILVFASDCADIPALLAWQLPGEWALVPLQIAVCLVILAVLLAPERWFRK